MSFLKGALGGLARGGSAILDSRKAEEDAQRERVDTNIYNTTGKLFQNAALVRDTRQAEIKANKEYTNLLVSKDSSMANDPAKMAYALSLPEEARQDLLKLVDSPTFQNANLPLSDYFEAIDDPIEYKDPVTLTERVRGKVVDRPLESSAYYGVSTTEDKEVDKIVAGYAGGFATAYNMSAARAQGLLDSATQDAKVQKFKINWANKKYQSAQDDAFNIAKLAASSMGMEKDSQGIAKLLTEQNSVAMGNAFTAWASGEGVSPLMHDSDPTLIPKFKKTSAYGAAREKVIKQMAKDMVEADGRSLDRSTKLFFSREYPGYWGGNANETPTDELVDAAYYEITANGKVDILRGRTIKQQLAKGKNNSGVTEKAVVETDEMLSEEVTLEDPKVVSDPDVSTKSAPAIGNELTTLKLSGVNVKELGFDTWEEAQADIDLKEEKGEGGTNGGITREEDVTRMNKEMRTAKGSYRKYLLDKLGDDYVEATNETKEAPIKPLTSYQKVMMDEKRGTIGAAKAYDQAVDIAIQSGDMEAIRRVQSIITGLTSKDIGYGVPDMLEELTAKIESALNK